MPHPLVSVSQSDCLIQDFYINLQKKQSDLDLHFFVKTGHIGVQKCQG